MGVTKKAKITFTCEPSLKDGLEEWAQSESRTLSNLIEMLIRQAYEERFSSADRPSDPQQSKPQQSKKQSKPQQSKPQQSKPQQSKPQQSKPQQSEPQRSQQRPRLDGGEQVKADLVSCQSYGQSPGELWRCGRKAVWRSWGSLGVRLVFI